jgi:hypothetical protein
MLAETGLKSIGAIRNHSGQALAYVYFEDEPSRRSAAPRQGIRANGGREAS